MNFDRISARTDRPSAIEEAEKGERLGTYAVLAPDGYLELPIVRLDHEVLLYRAENGRILSELSALAAKSGESLSLLRENFASTEMQGTMHDLLRDKARDPDGSIYDELARHGRQTEPLLIDHDGVVVNGNRRLAAMRELLAEDRERYSGFRTVLVSALPSGTSAATLEYIEAGLQMAPDLKLDYSWVNRRLKLRQHASDMARPAILAAYRFSNESEIDTELGELTLAEDYLRWIGAEGDYQRISGRTEDIEAFHGQLAMLEKQPVASVWRLLGFALLLTKPSLDRPLAHVYPFAEPVPPAVRHWVPRTLAEDRGLAEPQATGQNTPVDGRLATRLAAALGDPSEADATARMVVALQDTLKADQDRLIGGTRILGQLKKARETLEKLDFDTISADRRRRMRAEVAGLAALLREGGDDALASDLPSWDRLRAHIRHGLGRRRQ